MADARLTALEDELLGCYFARRPFEAAQLGCRWGRGIMPPVEQDSAEDIARDVVRIRDRLDALPADGLSESDRVTRRLMLEVCGYEAASLRAGWQRFVVAPLPEAGLASRILLFLPPARLSSAEDLELFARAVAAIPGALAGSLTELAVGRSRGQLPVRHLVERSIEQIEQYCALPVEQDPFLVAADQARIPDVTLLVSALRGSVTSTVRPAFAQYAARLREEVWPTARDSDHPGLCWIPWGGGIYTDAVREFTTLDVTAVHLHETGERLVESLEEEGAGLAAELGWSRDFAAARDRLRADPGLRFQSPVEMVAAARTAMTRAEGVVPEWITEPPDAACEVREMSALETTNGVLGRYETATLDGRRPGRYWLNVADPRSRARYEIEALTFHESVPGHHIEVSKSQHAVVDSAFRQLVGVLPYREGWALYMERYMSEVGGYTSPLEQLGMVSFALWRACRLVVDTGLHALGWGRDDAIGYMERHTALARRNIENEVDRYIAHPGSALGYMVGCLALGSVRRQRVAQPSSPVENRAFFTEVLGRGPLTMTLLGDTMNARIEI